jgi:lambda repressor-like predicted transcriptional regulator
MQGKNFFPTFWKTILASEGISLKQFALQHGLNYDVCRKVIAGNKKYPGTEKRVKNILSNSFPELTKPSL